MQMWSLHGRIGARWLKSGKYKIAVVKGMPIISLNGMTLLQSLHMGMALVVSFVVSLG